MAIFKKNKLIIAIFLIALFLRVYKLGSYPVSLSMDEVTFGYASYSVMHTLQDEYGNFLPLSYQGIGDFKPPVDVLLNIPFIYFLGLNEISVRLSGAIIGALTSIALIYLVKELGFERKVYLFSGFWLSISAWHINYSRAGYESITALFFVMLAALFFLKWRKNNKTTFLNISVVFFSLSVWSYHAQRLFVPMLFLYLILTSQRQIKKQKKLYFPMSILIIFSLPFIYSLFNGEGVGSRASELLITKSLEEEYNLYELLTKIFHQYLSYFDLRFIFWKALNLTPRNFQEVGLLYLVNLPLFIIGIHKFIHLKDNYSKKLLIFWFLASPVPASLTRGDPSAIRILLWIPVFAVFISLGFLETTKTKFYKLILSIYLVLLIINMYYFKIIYTQSFTNYYADLWHYGYKEAAQYICDNQKNYKKIILTNKYGIEDPSITTIPHYYVLFHCKINPSEYQQKQNLGNVEIRQPQWRIDRVNENWLLVGSRWDFPEDFNKSKITKTIKFPNGKDALYFVETP